MANELENFEALDQNAGAGVQNTRSENDAAKAARKAALSAAMQATIAESGDDYLKVKGSNSANIVITRVLGFGETGNIIETKKKDADGNGREVGAIAKNVGYKIQNVGSAPITYATEVFAKDASGKFVGSIVQKQIAPGETVAISRKYMTLFGCKPEFSNKFANGKLVRTSAGGKAVPGNVNLEAELEAYTFVFNDKEISVNDESIKDQIGKKVSVDGKNKYVVIPEYEEVFGYLNNAPVKAAGRQAKPAFDSQDLASNYIYRLASESGLV